MANFRLIARLVPLLLACAVLAPLLAGCSSGSAARQPLKVVATIAPLADWAQQVGRERVVVTQLVPTGVDPLTYQLTPANLQALAEADVVLFNGLGLEPWLTPEVTVAQAPNMTLLNMSQFLRARDRVVQNPAARTLRPDPDYEDSDPPPQRSTLLSPNVPSAYIWLNPGPSMAQRFVLLIADTFTRVDPEALRIYRSNAERYSGELENLDIWVEDQVRVWPRVRVNNNDKVPMLGLDQSWYYFAQQYDIELRAVQTANSYTPVLPAWTPVFVDRFRNQPEPTTLLGVRQPTGVLNPLAYSNYVDLIKANVAIMGQGLRRATASTSIVPIMRTP